MEKKARTNTKLAQPRNDVAQKDPADRIERDRAPDDHAEQRQAGRKPQRHRRETGQTGRREPCHFEQRVAGMPRVTAVPIVDDIGLATAEPRDHSAQKAILLGHRVQPRHDRLRHQTKIARITGDRNVGDARQQPIEKIGGQPFEDRFARARAPTPVDDVVSLIHARHHGTEQFRRILQIGVDDEHAVPARTIRDRQSPRADGRDCATGSRRRFPAGSAPSRECSSRCCPPSRRSPGRFRRIRRRRSRRPRSSDRGNAEYWLLR